MTRASNTAIVTERNSTQHKVYTKHYFQRCSRVQQLLWRKFLAPANICFPESPLWFNCNWTTLITSALPPKHTCLSIPVPVSGRERAIVRERERERESKRERERERGSFVLDGNTRLERSQDKTNTPWIMWGDIIIHGRAYKFLAGCFSAADLEGERVSISAQQSCFMLPIMVTNWIFVCF